MGIAERSRNRIKCPKCTSQNVEPVFSMCCVKTVRKARRHECRERRGFLGARGVLTGC